MLPGQSSQCHSIRSKFDTRNKQKQRPRKDEQFLKERSKFMFSKNVTGKEQNLKYRLRKSENEQDL